MEQQVYQNHDEISVLDWVLTIIITAIPLIGFIMLFVWGFGGGSHPSKANWAKATLLLLVLGILLYIMFGVALLGLFIAGS